MLFRRRSELSAPAGEALALLLTAPTFEVMPLKDSMTLAAALPAGSRVSVTASPVMGIERTVALSEQLQRAGFRAVRGCGSFAPIGATERGFERVFSAGGWAGFGSTIRSR